MRVTVGFNGSGLASVQQQLAKLSGQQAKQAYAEGLNDGGHHVRRGWQREMREQFDRPSDYILRSVQFRPATSERLSIDVQPTYYGGKGVDPQKILQAQEFGGARRDKRSEVALRRIGILPAGYQTAIPATPFPGSDDGRGNVRGGFLVRLLSYFQAMGEQGYRANMTDRGKARLHRGSKGREGVRFFVAYGRLRSGPTQHLAPGIWAATGTQGGVVRPVLMFVRNAAYEARISSERVAERADLEPYIERRIRYRIRKMVGE
ncbi:hypothetical protein AB4142_24110 [Variovorax sp. 2RAF20]